MIKYLILLFSFPAIAEYRVYQYIVKNKVVSANDQPQSTVIISSLNPQSYIAYNGGSQLISVDLLRTWVCPGYTGKKKPICPSPYEQIAAGGKP